MFNDDGEGAMGDDDGDGATGDDDDGDGATGNDDDGNGATGNDMAGYDEDDDGNWTKSTSMTKAGRATMTTTTTTTMTTMAMAQRDTTIKSRWRVALPVARAGNLPVVSVATHGHHVHGNSPLATPAAHANLPNIVIAARAGNLPA